MLIRFARWIPLFILVALCLLFFHQLAFSNLILGRGDTLTYFYPYWAARDAALQAGELPLWSSDIFMGVPLLANPQIGTFYPFNWLTIGLEAPDAIRFSILLHVTMASIGTFYFFQVAVRPMVLPALIAALSFGLSGYFGAHVEQINQLQGLAWLPWLLLLYHLIITRRVWLRYLLIFACLWALQIFSGHTQTVFISGVALGLYGLFSPHAEDIGIKKRARDIGLLALTTLITVILAIPQLLPALELTGMSNRGSGFDVNQATAFSLPPPYLARALLPSYDGLLFTEYIGYVGIIALGLALYAIVHRADHRTKRVWIIFTAIGLLFALGRYTIVYNNLAALPGFDLFRVPARWLALYTFGVAMLAGQGIVVLQNHPLQARRAFSVLMVLVILAVLARVLPILQADIVGAAQPTLITMMMWGIGLGILGVIFVLHKHRYCATLALTAIAVELFLASLIMPYNDLIPADTYLGQRFTISQMLALNDDQQPPSRMLPISGRLFNPGDVNTLQARFERRGLDDNAQQIAYTAVKSQEILYPNLGLQWGIPTIDGYGGGVLPTIYYSQFMSLLLPEDSLRTVDGRIGEMLAQPDCRGACVPQQAWLNLTDTAYIVADKNFDVVHNGIFYDTSLAEFWAQAPLSEPSFVFDDVHILLQAPRADLSTDSFDFLGTTYALAITDWATLVQLIMDDPDSILGVSVVNTRTNTFEQVIPTGFERILSSDIKLYRVEGASRVQLTGDVQVTADDWDGHERAIDLLQQNPELTVLHDAPRLEDTADGHTEMIRYSDTEVVIEATANSETYLLLADAHYPGWRATVNGELVEVYRANIMFRAVPIPAGESTIIFEFKPQLWFNAIRIGVSAWFAIIMLLCGLVLRRGNI